ncbi:MAG TPA: alpha/beta hydrolase [Bryobacteraceae bacterium]|nr:alpha/beta hydrolase [Bryobacteraceae bacterium]
MINGKVDSPDLKTVTADGMELAVWEWPGEAPALLFAHATGLHGRCWDRIVRMFPGRRCVAVDFRGHGRSAKPAPPCHWTAFHRDLEAVVERLGLEGAMGIGHSMGGHSVVAAARCFAALLLVDPTIFPEGSYGGTGFDASFIRRRRNRWKSPEEMFERFRDRAPFASWQPEVLRDYCEFGLAPDGGGFVLACPPEVEASIYEHSREREASLYAAIPYVTQPVTVMRAGVEPVPGVFNLAASPTAPDLARKFPHGRDVFLSGRNHFIPMEWPELVAEEIARIISDRTRQRGESARP